MKKWTKFLATTMTAGMLLAACGDDGNVDEEPGTEEPAVDEEPGTDEELPEEDPADEGVEEDE